MDLGFERPTLGDLVIVIIDKGDAAVGRSGENLGQVPALWRLLALQQGPAGSLITSKWTNSGSWSLHGRRSDSAGHRVSAPASRG